MFLIILLPFFIITYFILTYFLQLFFQGKCGKVKFSVFHILTFSVFYIFSVILSFEFSETTLGNRLLHMLGGGFLMSIVFYFSYKASLIKISKFQFFFSSFVIATCFGVFNELGESILQIYFGWGMSGYLTDTWLDLWANTIGALFGSLFFIFFINKNYETK